jgi:2-hydroxy-6-oxonona-2,4-dienedioate hydrolase
MARQADPVADVDPRLQRYRDAEAALWEHYGVEPTEQFIDLHSPRVRLRVVEVGSGDPIVFIGGTGGTGPYWAPLVRELAGFRCVMVDRPGWGLSSSMDYSQGEYKTVAAEVLRGTLDALGLEQTHVVGASIGGNWALGLAARHPSRVDRVVQLGGGPVTADTTHLTTFLRLLASPVGALMVRTPQGPQGVQRIVRRLGHGASVDGGRMDAYVAWRVAFERETDSMRHERDMLRALVRGRSMRPGVTFDDRELQAIEQPTLAVLGTADPYVTVASWERVVASLPSGELHMIDGAGHLCWYDDAKKVGGLVRAFLTGAETTPHPDG